MDRLDELESRSLYVLREARAQFRKLALLWSIGKDSTTLVWLARKAFLGTVPFPVLHIDTSHKFPEIYEFRDRWAREFGLTLLVAKNDVALAAGMGPATVLPADLSAVALAKADCQSAVVTPRGSAGNRSARDRGP